VGDVRELAIELVAERPDLIWMSPPCVDVSTAGARGGLDGGRSGAAWPAIDFIKRLSDVGRGPRLIVLENVNGLATSHGGEDLRAILAALTDTGYRVGALTADAKAFVPQSRARLFIVAAAADIAIHADLLASGPTRPWHTAAIAAVAEKCSGWQWWLLPAPAPRSVDLADILEPDGEVSWHSEKETKALLAIVPPKDADRLGDARAHGKTVGTLTRRMRPVADGMEQRAELRRDGVSACLRTASGGSSQQALVVADRGLIRTRPLTTRESARLMGLPDDYPLPRRRDDALKLLGDGVVPPVVRYLAANLLEPLLDAERSKDKPIRPGIKGATRSTTIYLLPDELRRLKRLALDLDISLHDLLLRGLDRVLAEAGQRPLTRYR
jgi:DNA (cytosine-5)-methyltransferase 1